MTEVTLIYPYFRPRDDNSIFRFPPLGLGYIASYLRQNGVSVDLVDCTFLSQEETLKRVRRSEPRIIGIQSMFSIRDKSIELANLLRDDCELLVAGGPLPSTDPADFLGPFDVVVIGEGEKTMLELVNQYDRNGDLSSVEGMAFKENGGIRYTPQRRLIENLDGIPLPSRDLFDNESYKDHYRKRYGYTITSVMTSRGCPFKCDFCSRPVFGNRVRSRSPESIVDEVESISSLGYDRIWFADDCFTLDRRRVIDICELMVDRAANVEWECLSRVDTMDEDVAEEMKQAGCVRVFFGLESGNDAVLAIMNKGISTGEARRAVEIMKLAGIEVGAFFIVGYPGETDNTVLDTVRFASSLPLDYLSFTVPYPIPGTNLYERVKDKIKSDGWETSERSMWVKEHKLIYASPFSETKLKFAMMKGYVQFHLRRKLGAPGYRLIGEPIEVATDFLFRQLH